MKYLYFVLIIFSSCTYNEIVPVCKPDDQVFADLIFPIIETNCIECHNEYSGRPAILTTYDGVINSIDNHSLKNLVTSLDMPPNGNLPLNITEINIIINWINCE